MALVDDGMNCPLCGQPIQDINTCFTTTMVGLEPPLSLLDDSAAHPDCVDKLEHKMEFVKAYNACWNQPALIIDRDGHVKWVEPSWRWYHQVWSILQIPAAFRRLMKKSQ